MEWASLLSVAADPATPSLVAPDLGFLGLSRFAAKTPDFWGWILLEFLGFSCANLDLSTGYADFSQNFFSLLFSRDRPAGTALGIWRAEGTKLFIGTA
jgi:hypothetical protein